jgi:PleD family two-component response regulator
MMLRTSLRAKNSQSSLISKNKSRLAQAVHWTVAMETDRTEQTETQNSLGVMLLDDNTERAAMVEQSLLQNGYRVLSMLTSANGLFNQIDRHRPDVIVIDLESPDRDVLES